MRKIILVSTVAALALASCKKEEAPVPSQQKNWLEIVPKENMDALDQKIWDIYQEFGVPIFYTDTLGYVDYGVVDEQGNPVLSYQMLRPVKPDMTVGEVMVPPVITLFETWKPEVREGKMLPLVEFIESELLPLARTGGFEIPVILIANTVSGYPPKRVWRNNNVVTISDSPMLAIPQMAANEKKTYRTQMITNGVGRSWDADLVPFRKVTEDLLTPVIGADPWSVTVNRTWTSVTERVAGATWRDIQVNNFYLTNYDRMMPVWQANVDYYRDRIAAGTATQADYEWLEAMAAGMNDLTVTRQNEAMWRTRYTRYDPRAYGLPPTWVDHRGSTFTALLNLRFNNVVPVTIPQDYYSVPTRTADFNAFFELLMGSTQAQLETTYAGWPVMLERLAILRQIFLDKGIDIETLK
jgi:hypothetical protein